LSNCAGVQEIKQETEPIFVQFYISLAI
jgi:hypothetical protein